MRGASDSGIYTVGQSDTVIVRGNTVELNVAGMEIENTSHADVHDNTATNNTGGILVFNLPGLEVERGAGTRVFTNQVFENNTMNFAPVGNIVGLVPTGTGIALLAAHDVEIFDNDVHDHATVNLGAISYVTTMIAVPTGRYDDIPTGIDVHDNRFGGTSDMPTGDLGALLIQALGELYPTGPYIVPDIAWDGARNPARIQAGTGDYAEADKLCFHDNGTATFIDLQYPLADATKPTTDFAAHACTHPAQPEVTLP